MAWKKTMDEEEIEKGDSKFPGFLWKPEAEGEEREGVYSEKEIIEDNEGILYHFNQDKENPENEDNPKLHWKMWGATILNNWMETAKPGLKTRIIFTGKRKNKTNKYYSNHYEVEQDVPEEMEGETQLPSSEPAHPAKIPEAKDPEPEHTEALRFEANGYIRDCRADTKEEAKDCLIDMLSKRMLVSEYSFSQEQIFKCALNILAEEDKE